MESFNTIYQDFNLMNGDYIKERATIKSYEELNPTSKNYNRYLFQDACNKNNNDDDNEYD